MTCCGRLWRNLGNHLRFAHGEEVVIPEQPRTGNWDEFACDGQKCGCHDPFLCSTCGCQHNELTCFCGAPAVGWVYDVMSDGQCIRGLAVCAAHQEEIG